jgi:hypothetical protein
MSGDSKYQLAFSSNGIYSSVAAYQPQIDTAITYSKDGLNFLTTVLPEVDFNGGIVFFCALYVSSLGLYFAGGYNGMKSQPCVIVSIDGISWSYSGITGFPLMTPTPNNLVRGMKYINSTVWALGRFDSLNTGAMVSTDGFTWAATTSLISLSTYDIAYGNGRYVVICDATFGPAFSAIVYSTDGINWSGSSDAVLTNFTPVKIAFGNGVFVAVGSTTNSTSVIKYSNNGVNWFNSDFAYVTGDYKRNIKFNNNIFMAIGGAAQNTGRAGNQISIVKSVNGINWTPILSGGVNSDALGGGSPPYALDVEYGQLTIIPNLSTMYLEVQKSTPYQSSIYEFKAFALSTQITPTNISTSISSIIDNNLNTLFWPDDSQTKFTTTYPMVLNFSSVVNSINKVQFYVPTGLSNVPFTGLTIQTAATSNIIYQNNRVLNTDFLNLPSYALYETNIVPPLSTVSSLFITFNKTSYSSLQMYEVKALYDLNAQITPITPISIIDLNRRGGTSLSNTFDNNLSTSWIPAIYARESTLALNYTFSTILTNANRMQIYNGTTQNTSSLIDKILVYSDSNKTSLLYSNSAPVYNQFSFYNQFDFNITPPARSRTLYVELTKTTPGTPVINEIKFYSIGGEATSSAGFTGGTLATMQQGVIPVNPYDGGGGSNSLGGRGADATPSIGAALDPAYNTARIASQRLEATATLATVNLKNLITYLSVDTRNTLLTLVNTVYPLNIERAANGSYTGGFFVRAGNYVNNSSNYYNTNVLGSVTDAAQSFNNGGKLYAQYYDAVNTNNTASATNLLSSIIGNNSNLNYVQGVFDYIFGNHGTESIAGALENSIIRDSINADRSIINYNLPVNIPILYNTRIPVMVSTISSLIYSLSTNALTADVVNTKLISIGTYRLLSDIQDAVGAINTFNAYSNTFANINASLDKLNLMNSPFGPWNIYGSVAALVPAYDITIGFIPDTIVFDRNNYRYSGFYIEPQMGTPYIDIGFISTFTNPNNYPGEDLYYPNIANNVNDAAAINPINALTTANTANPAYPASSQLPYLDSSNIPTSYAYYYIDGEGRHLTNSGYFYNNVANDSNYSFTVNPKNSTILSYGEYVTEDYYDPRQNNEGHIYQYDSQFGPTSDKYSYDAYINGTLSFGGTTPFKYSTPNREIQTPNSSTETNNRYWDEFNRVDTSSRYNDGTMVINQAYLNQGYPTDDRYSDNNGYSTSYPYVDAVTTFNVNEPYSKFDIAASNEIVYKLQYENNYLPPSIYYGYLTSSSNFTGYTSIGPTGSYTVFKPYNLLPVTNISNAANTINQLLLNINSVVTNAYSIYTKPSSGGLTGSYLRGGSPGAITLYTGQPVTANLGGGGGGGGYYGGGGGSSNSAGGGGGGFVYSRELFTILDYATAVVNSNSATPGAYELVPLLSNPNVPASTRLTNYAQGGSGTSGAHGLIIFTYEAAATVPASNQQTAIPNYIDGSRLSLFTAPVTYELERTIKFVNYADSIETTPYAGFNWVWYRSYLSLTGNTLLTNMKASSSIPTLPTETFPRLPGIVYSILANSFSTVSTFYAGSKTSGAISSITDGIAFAFNIFQTSFIQVPYNDPSYIEMTEIYGLLDYLQDPNNLARPHLDPQNPQLDRIFGGVPRFGYWANPFLTSASYVGFDVGPSMYAPSPLSTFVRTNKQVTAMYGLVMEQCLSTGIYEFKDIMAYKPTVSEAALYGSNWLTVTQMPEAYVTRSLTSKNTSSNIPVQPYTMKNAINGRFPLFNYKVFTTPVRVELSPFNTPIHMINDFESVNSYFYTFQNIALDNVSSLTLTTVAMTSTTININQRNITDLSNFGSNIIGTAVTEGLFSTYTQAVSKFGFNKTITNDFTPTLGLSNGAYYNSYTPQSAISSVNVGKAINDYNGNFYVADNAGGINLYENICTFKIYQTPFLNTSYNYASPGYILGQYLQNNKRPIFDYLVSKYENIWHVQGTQNLSTIYGARLGTNYDFIITTNFLNQVFYPTHKIILTRKNATTNPITDITDVTDYPSYPRTEMFFYTNYSSMVTDISGQFALEKSNNFANSDVNSGYFFNSYINNIGLTKSVNYNNSDPNSFNYLAIRAYSPSETFKSLVRFYLPGRYDFGFLSLADLSNEIYTIQTDTNTNPQYKKILGLYHSSFALSKTFGGSGLPGFSGYNVSSINFGDFLSQYINIFSTINTTSVIVSTVNGSLQNGIINLINGDLKYILPSYIATRERITDPLEFMLPLSTVVADSNRKIDEYGLGYNLGFNYADTNFATSQKADSFFKILDDYIYLKMNPEYNMNRLDIAGKEDLAATMDSMAQQNLYNCKLLLNNFGTFATTFVQNPVSFNPVIGKLDKLSFAWYDVTGQIINNNECEWSGALQIVEKKDIATDDSTVPKSG